MSVFINNDAVLLLELFKTFCSNYYYYAGTVKPQMVKLCGQTYSIFQTVFSDNSANSDL